MFVSRLSSKQTIFCFCSNRNKPKLDPFRFFFVFFAKLKKNFGLFRCFGTVSKRTETKYSAFRNKSKLKIITLLCNGLGHGEHGHEYGKKMETDTIF
jgi:hypothetical protein